MPVLSQSSREVKLQARAKDAMPAGSFGNLTFPTVIASGKAGHVWDESGNEYIDYLLGSGPMLIGHAHPAVVDAVQAQIVKGTTFFANNRAGIEMAEAIIAAVPCAEKVRFYSSGTEADFYVMRLVRAFRKRDKILKFEGGYHGMSDGALMSMGPKTPSQFPNPIPDSPGIPKSACDDVLVAPFNDIDYAVNLIRERHGELAGVLVEPFQRLIPPAPGFLEALREVTTIYQIPLIFDEVVTGFRFAYGGAQEYYGVIPDLCTLGKVCGGGYPLAALAGRADIMEHFDRSIVGAERYLTQIGTLSGNPVAAVAGLATMQVLRQPGTYERLFATGNELLNDLQQQLAESGLPAQVIGAAPMFDVVFTREVVRNYRDTQLGNTSLSNRFNTLLRECGIFKSDNKYYVSLAHTAEDVAFTSDAWRSALEQLVHEQRA
jgi:glutamate-1-semialdehyde 2,1-aminomutase